MLNSLSVCLSSIAKYTPFDDNSRAVAKSTVGIETPFYTKAHDASLLTLVFYCVRIGTSKHYGGLGEAAERLAVSFVAVVSTLFSPPPIMRLRPLGSGYNHTKEASVMLTTPTQFAPMTITGGATC